ncbi:LysR family transcriptional regulator [Enterobacter cloacae]|jgi:DNA-binding transcriptional LysR family regulator|uniref:LysR family transcriptional regulator n=1 Tax=Enterobacter cloacae complex TaxID=354276 RepID=UPI001251C07A|nr:MULTISPECIES: LysR family transcriptional regulator [Enterobacter cloacae complex]HCM9685012.1 LysR family transcriptional regulator [Enterobacter cloacae subsp. cloacae]EKT9189362.1 LysR family transcriptional regulator [Enterobacter cloacae]EKU3857805.1 LysR family transcriptional regulator [Enterobacter cloacae]EKX9061906.1 LysR family transcriptional regulator [Enterobacter cloacae]ELR9202196.1 LysR family transcriptional regulator [Enterobacter cloacae]
MDRVIAAQVYNRICELGSLSAAARALGISRPMVSRYLEQMEKWAGTRLVNRSTRKLTLTAAGEKVLLKTRTLSQLSQEIEGQSEKDLPSGTLRVACAHFTAMHLIAPVLPGLLSRYPQLRIELDVNNHPVSLVGERIDVAIRITDNPEPGMIARRLGECRSVLCASPQYLATHGTPEQVKELAQHNCLHYSFFAGQAWHFLTPEGENVSVAVSGNLSASISSLLMEAAVKHCGIAMLPEQEAHAAIEQGTLVPLLSSLTPKALAIHGIYQSREFQPAALRVFLDEIAHHLSGDVQRE